MFLVISSSLHPTSRSRILARAAVEQLQQTGRDATLFDLVVKNLPACDGASAYGDANVKELSELIHHAEAILVASPVYNYDVNAALKNAVELTGRAWTGKVVSLMLAAGGQGSYMSAMGLANSLMLDFRCLIVPRFIYATGDAFEGDGLADEEIQQRVNMLVSETTKLADAINRSL
ncbi:NADPH-dependent FMN reductase [Rhodopirellula maiorica SM1]|uniref:NADPH-dependent FMN reductase n=1 Tax=Rhodopirellula maiorica SM1 TaxID=1265738 RepID=M5RV93_9BACT|nr:NAD(P)H-dependent oxidoreductase [Rhodopirellula maiorica]EMI17869.1 NADPH-dependent FMN reductase [Rhodopirellula maiorica SM1]